MNSEHGNGSGSSKHRRIAEEVSVNLDESFFEHSGGIRTNSETTRNEVAHSTTENSKSSTSVPSSSSENSSDDFFQVDTIIIPLSKTTDHEAPPKSKENTKPPLRDGKNDVYSGPLFQLEEIFGSSRSTSQVSDVSHESFIPILSPTQSPPIQVMERPRGFDPDRIPASVFAKPCSHVDWSVASNESLFSIPIGNASFSRDHAFKLAGENNKSNEIGNSGELYISKEFYRSGELNNSSGFYMSGELQNSCELVRFRQPSPVTKGEHKARNFDLGKTEVCEKTKDNLPSRTIRIEGEMNVEANRHLDETRTNIQSLGFPINKKSSKSPCICKNCSCEFCSCKWPCCSSCYCKCPSFSSCCCKCPSCSNCCCNCPSCSSCRFKWPSCSCKWPSCCCNWPSCSNCSCKWPSCCCKRPCCSCKGLGSPCCSCKWLCSPSCCCKRPSCSGCCCKSTHGCKFSGWPSCHCKCSTWPSCHRGFPSWSRCSCKCSSRLSCCSKSHFSTCRCTSCNCWKCTPKKLCC